MGIKKKDDWFKKYQEWTVVALVFCIVLFGLYAVVMIITDRVEPNYEINMPVSKPPEEGDL